MDIVIIPAYNPNQELVALVRELIDHGIKHIIIVNDGSVEQSLPILDQLQKDTTILNHTTNQGKGEAIKTALKYLLEHNYPAQGIVLMDADGQHRPEDAISLLKKLHEVKSGLVLGVRSFQGKIPYRSLFGNTLTKYVFRMTSGVFVSDTQTGLRAFGLDMIPKLLAVKGKRYEYEMNVLLACAKHNIPMIEIPIATIYQDDKNSSSHFRAIRDSARIYGHIIAFSGASFLSFLLDFLLFFPIVWLFSTFLTAPVALVCGNIMTRIMSASFNYYLNRKFVFQYNKNRTKSMISYAILAIVILTLNTALLSFLHEALHLSRIFAKLFTEFILFFFSYTLQKFVVFHD